MAELSNKHSTDPSPSAETLRKVAAVRDLRSEAAAEIYKERGDSMPAKVQERALKIMNEGRDRK